MNIRSKIPNLTTDRRVQLAPAVKEWVSATAYLLQALHAGSYSVRHRHRLSALYRERLAAKRRKAQAAGARCQARKLFAELPPYSQRKGLNVKLVLDIYYAAIEGGLPEGYAVRLGREMWLLIFDKACAPKTIRRILAKVEAAGGPDIAPIEAYADQLSVPHRKAILKEAA